MYLLELRNRRLWFFYENYRRATDVVRGSRSAERMKGSSRRETALELALKVGGYDERRSRTKRRVGKSTERCERGGQFLIRCREWLDEGVYKTTVTATTTITINNNNNANVHGSITDDTDAQYHLRHRSSQGCMEPRASERDQETGR